MQRKQLPRWKRLRNSKNTEARILLLHTYAIARDKSKAQQILSELNARYKYEPISHHQFAVIFTGLGGKVRAFDRLDKA
jgi:hypothetical protein